ncbi:glycosyltransferase domain-containing protein [Mixta calida]|uniref:glycosyltransferase domain-containing protein n=1 Tax=Mixta calida TaxID=665913 RepID=UPI0034D49FCB
MPNYNINQEKLVIYSVVTGGYDNIFPIKEIDELCDYYIISNEQIDLPYPWKLIILDDNGLGNKNFNRYYKINPHVIFPNYSYSLYIDGNISLCGKLHQWSQKKLQKKGFAIFRHPERKSIYDEGKICSYIGTDFFWVINRQMKRYKKEGFDKKELFEANILLRKHNEPDVINVMKCWWAEYSNKKNAKRDQLALPYVLWKMNYSVEDMGSSDARFKHEYFEYMPHASNRHSTLNTKIKKVVNRTIGRLCYG